MKAKVWLNLGLIAALVALSLFVYFKSKQDVAPAARISTLKRADITRIAIEPRGAAPIRLEKQNGAWRLTAPFGAAAELTQADRLLDIVNATPKHEIAKPDLAQLDLDPPITRVTLDDQAFSFGRVNDITYEQYLATAGKVYVVAPLYGYDIPTDANKLLSRRLLDFNDIPVGFDFGRYRIERDAKGTWAASGDFPIAKDAPVTQDDFNRWTAEWTLTSALSVEPDKGGARGGEPISLRFKDGKVVRMRVLQKEPQFQLLREDNGMRYHFGAEVGRRLLDPRVTAKKS